MRLTVVLLALSFLVLAAEPAAVMAGAQEYSSTFADPQDLPASEALSPGPEAYQPGSEGYPRTSEEYPSASEGQPDTSRALAAPQESPQTSKEYQLRSEEYAMPQGYPSMSEGHPMVSQEYEPGGYPSASEAISEDEPKGSPHEEPRESQSMSGEYGIPEEYPSEVSPVSGAQGSSLTRQRAQSLESLVPLVNAIPALLISGIGLCASVILACLSPLFGFLGFLCSPALCVIGALIGAISGAFVSPVVTSLVCGGGSFSIGAFINSCIAFLCSELFAVCCGGNVVTCVVPWFFQLVWLAFSWSWISAGGFGLGMVIFIIIAAIGMIIIAPVSACCSAIPVIGWIWNGLWLAILVLAFVVVMVAFFIIFDLLWSLLIPVIDLGIGALLLILGWAEAGTGWLIFLAILSTIGFCCGTIPTTLIDIIMGCIYLCFDIVGYTPISFCMYCFSLIATCLGIIFGWIPQCVAVAPSVSAVAGLFSGVACALPPSIAGFVSGFIPVIGQVIGCLAGGCGGGALCCLLGLPVLPVIMLTAAAMSACVSLLALASYVAERTRTSDVFLGVLGAVGSFATGITSAVLESARTIIGHIMPVLARFAGPLLRLLDVCIRVVGVYKDMAPLFFALWYVVYALCASTGILSCCIGPCIAVPGMVCNFCAQVLWAFLVDQRLGGRAPALILEVLRESIR